VGSHRQLLPRLSGACAVGKEKTAVLVEGFDRQRRPVLLVLV